MKSFLTTSSLAKAALLFLGMSCLQAGAQDITLNAYVDANNNCLRDPGEQPVRSQHFSFGYHSTTSQPSILLNGITDCNGQLVFDIQDLDPNNLTNGLSLWPYAYPAASPNEMNYYVSPCFNYNNLPYGTTIDVPFTGLPDTVSVNDVDLTIAHKYSSDNYEVGDTATFCNPFSRAYIRVRANQYKTCLSGPDAEFSLTVDGVLYDQVVLNTSAAYSVVATPASTLTTNYNLGGNEHFGWNEADINYEFPVQLLSPGLHKITFKADPYHGIVEGKSYDFYIFRDQCTAVKLYSYLDCNADCVQDPTEKLSAGHSAMSSLIGYDYFYSEEEIDLQTGMPSGYQTLYIPSSYSGNFTFTVLAVQGHTVCPSFTNTLSLNPGTMYQYTVGVQNPSPDYWGLYGEVHDWNNPYPYAPAPGTVFPASIVLGIDSFNHCLPANIGDVKLLLPLDFLFVNPTLGTPAPDAIISTSNGYEIIWNGLDFMNVDSLNFNLQVNPQAYINDSISCMHVYTAQNGLPYIGGGWRCYNASAQPVGIHELQKTVNVQFYPNPVSDQLHLQADQELTSVRVTNLMGEVLSEVEMNSRSYDLPVQQLSPGVYVLYATDTDGNTGVYKFIKQ